MFTSKEEMQRAVHDELLVQLDGLLEIEIGNYVFEKLEANGIERTFPSKDEISTPELWVSTAGGGLDVFVLDPRYVTVGDFMRTVSFKANEECGFISKVIKMPHREGVFYDADDWCMIGHYHPDDLLYLILHWQERKEEMREEADRILDAYIEWHEKEMEVQNDEE